MLGRWIVVRGREELQVHNIVVLLQCVTQLQIQFCQLCVFLVNFFKFLIDQWSSLNDISFRGSEVRRIWANSLWISLVKHHQNLEKQNPKSQLF